MHEFTGDEVGPAWLTRRQGDRVELISSDESVAQVCVQTLFHGRPSHANNGVEIRYVCPNSSCAKASARECASTNQRER